ncbi:ABC-2 transporter permease [Amphibacillus sediminis]|uniref:ABC-2 transporter permease n=1 Tax=Amphibacillus sediminis TaxID=360185 RepID=UPI0008328CD2|nr:ABC-2 transporter permease [Amphibacillus sediminis]
MNGLILKDLLILSKKAKLPEILIQLVLSMLFAWQYGINYLIPILVFLFSLTNINCFYVLSSEDEKVKWKQQLSALPLSRDDIINSRHLTILFTSLLQLLFLTIISLVMQIFVEELNLLSSILVSFFGSIFVFLAGMLHISLRKVLGVTASILSMVLSMAIFALLAYMWSKMDFDLLAASYGDYIFLFATAIVMAGMIERLCYFFEKVFYYRHE